MRIISWMSCIALFLVASLEIPLAQMPAGSNLPAGVPGDYVITPSGYFHPSCVRELAAGETLLAFGRVVQHADGTLESVPVCSYPHYNARGEAVTASTQRTPEINGWVEDAETTTSSSYGELIAYWPVPPAPTSIAGQILYFFDGLEDINDVVSIIQPVLGWNGDDMLSNQWSIASWNCCPSGITWYSTPVAVNPGDTIQGTVKDTCSPGTLSCPTWNITTKDLTTGNSTSLNSTPSEGQTFNWAFAGVLEVYNVVQCSDYPPNASITFSNLALYNDNFAQISYPGWSFVNRASGLTPQCSYGGGVAATQVSLDYGSITASVSPTSVNFGQHFYGDPPVRRSVTLTNNGISPITITSIGQNLVDPFLVTSTTCGVGLGAGANCSITVEFDTTNAPNGTSSQTMNIVDSATNSPQGVPLTGKMSCPGGQCP
jgi:hypothetical protein